MATFTIEAPNGRSVTIEGDREPNEQELQEILRGEGLLAPKADQDPFLRRVAEKENLTGEQFTELVKTFEGSYQKYATEEKVGKLDRAGVHARESFFQNTVAGAMVRGAESESTNQRFKGYLDEKLKDDPKWQEESQRLQAKRFEALKKEAARYGEYLGMPDSKGVLEKAMVATGAIAGTLPSPESLVGVGTKSATVAGRLGKAALEGAAVNLATEAPIQASAIAANRQDGYSAAQAATGAALGAGVGAGMRGVAEGVSRAIPAPQPRGEIPTRIEDVTYRSEDFAKARAEERAQADAEFEDPIKVLTPEQAQDSRRMEKVAVKAADEIRGKDKWLEWDMKNRPEGLAKELEASMTRNQLGIVAGPADLPKSIREIPEKIWALFRPGGKLPRPIFNEKVFAEGKIVGEVREMNRILTNTRKEAFRVYGQKKALGLDKQIGPEDLAAMNDYLAGRHPRKSITDEKLLMRLDEMRAHRMRLSKAAKNVVGSRLAETIDNNMDVYLHRAYRIFDDPEWADKMRDALFVRDGSKARAIVDDVKAYLYDVRKDEFVKEANAQGLAKGTREYDGYIDSRLTGEVGKLLDRGDSSDIWEVISTKGRDVSTITKRKNIDETIRRLWGEYEDPFVNYGNTVTKVAQLVEMSKFYNRMFDVDVAGRMLKKDAIDGFDSQIPESARYGDLAGMYTTPELREVLITLDELASVNNPIWRGFLKVNASVNYGKTVGSPTTQIRNLQSGVIMALIQGHNPFGKHFKTAFRRVGSDIFNKEGNIRVEQVKEYASLALFDENPDIGELNGVWRDVMAKGPVHSIGELRQRLRTIGKMPAKFYQGVDNLMRIFIFESELARYSDALGIPANDVALRKQVALMTRDIYPTYSNVGKLVKYMRRFPAVGQFMSFHSEIIRTSYNTAELGIRELRSGNPKLMKIGATRLAGLTAAGIGAHAFTHQVNNIFGSDPDQREAAKRFIAPWDKDGNLIMNVKDDGSFDYLNTSYTNPYSIYGDMAMLAMDDIPDGEKIGRLVSKALGPFINAPILTNTIADIVKNPEGRARNPNASKGEQFNSSIAYAFDNLAPGIFPQSERQIKAWTGKRGDFGREYNKAVEAGAFLGGRVSSGSPTEAMRFSIPRFNKTVTSFSTDFSKAVRKNPNLSPDEIVGLYRQTNENRKNAYAELRRDYEAALTMGVNPKDMFNAMLGAGLSRDDLTAIRKGVMREYWPSDEKLRESNFDSNTRMKLLEARRNFHMAPLPQ